jgi:hypothetical protein
MWISSHQEPDCNNQIYLSSLLRIMLPIDYTPKIGTGYTVAEPCVICNEVSYSSAVDKC